MKPFKFLIFPLLVFYISCKEQTKTLKDSSETRIEQKIKTEDVSYNINEKQYKSFVAYDESLNTAKPIVFVIPEWWGLNDYAKFRANELAKLGYFAMVVDFYGNSKVVTTPNEAEKLATPFYENPQLAKQVFDSAKEKVLSFKNIDINKMAVIGYCFGGAQALNIARQEADLKGAVSFHGNLETGVNANNNSVKILVCNGEDDSFVSQEEIAAFKKEMDSSKIDYKFINYPNAVHSFTNPASTQVGRKFDMKIAYNKEADENSWQEMKTFLEEIFK